MPGSGSKHWRQSHSVIPSPTTNYRLKRRFVNISVTLFWQHSQHNQHTRSSWGSLTRTGPVFTPLSIIPLSRRVRHNKGPKLSPSSSRPQKSGPLPHLSTPTPARNGRQPRIQAAPRRRRHGHHRHHQPLRIRAQQKQLTIKAYAALSLSQKKARHRRRRSRHPGYHRRRSGRLGCPAEAQRELVRGGAGWRCDYG